MPGGITHASVKRSYNQAAVLSPRLALTAPCTGARTCNSTKMTPTEASGHSKPLPALTAAISAPMAMANTAGSTPRSSKRAHHAIANPASAFGSTEKNFHSSRSFSAIGAFCLRPRPSDCKNLTGRSVVHGDVIARGAEAQIHGRAHAGELAEIVDEVRLIEIAARVRDARP